MSKVFLRQQAELYPDDGSADLRPRTRGECVGGERPCPWMSCRYHLALDVDQVRGSIKENFPDRELEELPDTCALDVADRGGLILEDVAERMNLTRERARQLEDQALSRLPSEVLAQHRSEGA